MKCSCILNDNFNFSIDYKKDHIIFRDYSEWGTQPHNQKLDTYTLEIYNDELVKKIEVPLNGSVIIKNCDLPFSNKCGSDGIYKFQTFNCGETYYKYEFVYPHIMCSYTKLLVKLKPDEYHKIYDILQQIEVIKANVNIENITDALKHYEILQDMIVHLNCKC